MITVASTARIFVFTEPTDMRRSFDGLSGIVAEHVDVTLLSGHWFLFFNRRRDCVKILAWDRDGLMIWYKRLEKRGTIRNGRPMRWRFIGGCSTSRIAAGR